MEYVTYISLFNFHFFNFFRGLPTTLHGTYFTKPLMFSVSKNLFKIDKWECLLDNKLGMHELFRNFCVSVCLSISLNDFYICYWHFAAKEVSRADSYLLSLPFIEDTK